MNKLIEKEGILNYVNDYYVSVNGNFNMLYIENEKYIAIYTNNIVISKLLAEFSIFTYYEDFINGQVNSKSNSDYSRIRLATEKDLPYIEKTYTRSGYNQLLNRINQKQVIA